MRILVFGLIAVALAITWYLTPHDSVRLADHLIAENHLYSLNDDEEHQLNRFMEELLDDQGITKPIAVNRPYDKQYFNIYVIDSTQTTNQYVAHGSAAYVYRSDTIFIDSSYFDFNGIPIFGIAEEPVVDNITAALRVHSFFVLAHEIGHRQSDLRSFWQKIWGGAEFNRESERAADTFAINALLTLYQSSLTAEDSPIPGPISQLLAFLEGEPTPLQVLSDHVSYSVGFISEEFLSSEFPILSKTQTHPVFFSRMLSILDFLEARAIEVGDAESLRRLSLARNISSATSELLNRQPTEIMFSNPVQYVFADNENLYYIENEESKFTAIALDSLPTGELTKIESEAPEKAATVRYAWAGDNDRISVFQRDGVMRLFDQSSETERPSVDTRPVMGDMSCWPRMFIPPQPTDRVFVFRCLDGVERLLVIDSAGNIVTQQLKETILLVLNRSDSSAEQIVIHGLELSASLSPMVVFSLQDQAFALHLDQQLQPDTLTELAYPVHRLPAPFFHQGKRIMPSVFLSDADNNVYYLQGNDIFREFGLYDAKILDEAPVAEVDLSPSADFFELSQDLAIRRVEQLGHNRLFVNVHDTGAYIIDFNAREIKAIARSELKSREQVLSNQRGDWLFYQKYGSRVLVLREPGG